MEIILANEEHVARILEIYADARRYMRESGNPDQWGESYPEESLVRADLAARQLYLCVEGEEILGVFVYFEGHEPTYDRIFDGAWQNDRPAGVMHRVAVAKHGCGVVAFCFAYCFAKCQNLKIDTHRNNLPMQRALAKNGFSYCGRILLSNGDDRLAYQKCGFSS